MLQPTERPPASRAPRLAASITPGPPPVITVKPRPAERAADFAGHRVVAVVLVEARRSKHRHARSNEMQRAESANEVAARAHQQPEFLEAGMRAFEEVRDQVRPSKNDLL